MNQNTENLETWVPVSGYEGLYEVSDHVRVRSLPRYDAAGRWNAGRVLKQSKTPNGYRIVGFTRNGRQKNVAVHVLVATTFLGPRPEGMVCCHYDDDRDNNHLTNLRWDTYEGNAEDRRRNLGVYVPNFVPRGPTSVPYCPKGHAYDDANTYVTRAGSRQCRKCKSEWVRDYRRSRSPR